MNKLAFVKKNSIGKPVTLEDLLIQEPTKKMLRVST